MRPSGAVQLPLDLSSRTEPDQSGQLPMVPVLRVPIYSPAPGPCFWPVCHQYPWSELQSRESTV